MEIPFTLSLSRALLFDGTEGCRAGERPLRSPADRTRDCGDGATDLFSGFVGFSMQVWSDCDCLRRPARLTPARFRLLTTTRRCRVFHTMVSQSPAPRSVNSGVV